MEQRIGTWILGTAGLNLELIPFEQRADKTRWQGGPLYRIKDVFSTANGSWELTPGKFGSIDDWARSEYWQGAKFDGAGGDHNFFVKVLDEAGNPMAGKGIMWRQGDISAADWQPTAQKQAKPDGSENIPVQNSYVPARGEHGSWSGTTVGRADLLRGVDLPSNNHISTFVVFQAVAEEPEPEPEPEPGGVFEKEVLALLAEIAIGVAKIAKHYA